MDRTEQMRQDDTLPQAGAGSPGGAGGGDPAHGPVDVHALAERVYRLMVAEVRLERARGQHTMHAPTRR